MVEIILPDPSPLLSHQPVAQEGITVVIASQLGNHAMTESRVQGFVWEELLGGTQQPPPPPCTEGIITSCLLCVGNIQITRDEWSLIYKRSLCYGCICLSNSPSICVCPGTLLASFCSALNHSWEEQVQLALRRPTWQFNCWFSSNYLRVSN